MIKRVDSPDANPSVRLEDLGLLDSAVVHAMGDETVSTDATLVVDLQGRITRMKGSMICAS